MNWIDFLNDIFEADQVEVLRFALRIDAKIHVYGEGLGKSTVVDVLNAIGYRASAPDFVNGGRNGSCGVPDGTGCVCFNIKKRKPKQMIPFLRAVLISQKHEINRWVNALDLEKRIADLSQRVSSLEQQSKVPSIEVALETTGQLRLA